MSWIEIGLEGSRASFRPGEEVAGAVAWSVAEEPGSEATAAAPERAVVRLAWFTRGKGDRDSGVAAEVELPEPAASDRRDFRLRLPEGPYSVSGKLVSVVWVVEAILEPGERAQHVEIVVSPTGREVRLYPDAPEFEAEPPEA